MNLLQTVSPPRLALPDYLAAPAVVIPSRNVRRGRTARYRWHGVIVGRAWPAEFDEAEYLHMLVGKRKRLAQPDAYTRHGAPIYRLSDREKREARRLLDARCLDGYETHNVACNAGRAAVLNYIANTAGLTGVQYFAVGTGTPPTNGVQASDTQLWAEYFRKAFSTATVSSTQVDISTVFQASEGNTTYTECGIAGDGATATANSGQLFAHAPYAYTKSSSVTLTNDYYVNMN